MIKTIEDETDLIQYGQKEETDYFGINPLELKKDGWKQDLLVTPEGTYAFADAFFIPGDVLETTTRQTYSVFDWLGDIGGLHDSVFLIMEAVLRSYQGFFQANLLLSSLFRFKPSFNLSHGSNEKDVQQSELKWALGSTERIKGINYFFYCLCLKSKARIEYHKRLEKASRQIEKEMDLGRFIRRQR